MTREWRNIHQQTLPQTQSQWTLKSLHTPGNLAQPPLLSKLNYPLWPKYWQMHTKNIVEEEVTT